MNFQSYSTRWLAILSLIAAGSLSASPALAQNEEVDDELEEITVTGSRIRRDEYTSAAPLQTFDVETARKSGITTVSELLQQSTITYGQQINGQLNTNAGKLGSSGPLTESHLRKGKRRSCQNRTQVISGRVTTLDAPKGCDCTTVKRWPS
jgi:hypothetical protein